MEGFKTTAPVYKNLGLNEIPFSNKDVFSDSVTYFGWLSPNASPEENCWRIMRKTENNGIIRYEFPNGSDGFNYSWDNRYNYSYSR